MAPMTGSGPGRSAGQFCGRWWSVRIAVHHPEPPWEEAGAMDRDGHKSHRHRRSLAPLALGALGIVYGDIGTSPLYALRETFRGRGHELAVSESNVLGVLSLAFWSLIAIISVKYLTFVMRVDNDGEGGILALTSLLPSRSDGRRDAQWLLFLVGLFGTALLYGDGMITPAISVLAAVEGTTVALPGLEEWVIPLAVAILIGLFAIQSRGTAVVGSLFGPVMLVWFSTMRCSASCSS
jgi:KUP system potassium uptake protein